MQKTLQNALEEFAKRLKQASILNPEAEAEWLAAHGLVVPRSVLLQKRKDLLDPSLYEKLDALISRREKGEPFAYITGHVDFFGASLSIDNSVLIPRLETELLAEKIASALQKENLKGKVLWDLCTGSGALAISLKKKFPELLVFASDISRRALEKAKENALRNSVEVEFYEGDLFKPFEHKKCDFFVANPPYIDEKELQSLSHEVKAYEPHLALFAKRRGFEFYEKIAASLKNHLSPSGKAWLEMGKDQGEDLKRIFSDFPSVIIAKDLSNHDRFLILK